jgi:hypothetical protein
MRGQRGRQCAYLAPAHRIGLVHHAKGRRSRLADASRRKVNIDDRIHPVDHMGVLIHVMAEQRDRAWGCREQPEKLLEQRGGDVTGLRHRPDVMARFNAFPKAFGRTHAAGQEIPVGHACLVAKSEQPVHQRHVAARADGQV